MSAISLGPFAVCVFHHPCPLAVHVRHCLGPLDVHVAIALVFLLFVFNITLGPLGVHVGDCFGPFAICVLPSPLAILVQHRVGASPFSCL